jgi:hypothetical protein
MTESSSSPHNPSPDRRSGRKFRYGDNAGRDDEDYPLSRHEQDMSPEEVEAYLARQIELEAQLNPGGNGPRTAPGTSGKKFQSRTAGEAAVRTTASSANRRHPGSEESSEPSTKPFRRRRPDQDFPELTDPASVVAHQPLVDAFARGRGVSLHHARLEPWKKVFAALAAFGEPTQHIAVEVLRPDGDRQYSADIRCCSGTIGLRTPNAEPAPQPLVSAEADFSERRDDRTPCSGTADAGERFAARFLGLRARRNPDRTRLDWR